MNIVSIGGRYKPTNGGNAKRISNMCEALSRQGNVVTVMTCDGYGSQKHKETIENVNVLRYADCNSLVADVKNVLRDTKADVILVHQETFLRMLKGARLTVPIVYECHAIEPHPTKWKEVVFNILRKGYFREDFVKRVFVLSKNAGGAFARKFSYPAERIVYTPNGLDKAAAYTDKMHYGENESFVYGYSGTLYEFQGIKILLRYAKDILDIAPDVKLMIVGGGPMEADVRAFVAENGLEGRITVTGSVNQERFDELTQTFDVMLVPRPSTPSTESAVPLKIFDAVIHKKPAIISNVSGLTEAFSEKAALIYDTKTPEDLVECCRRLYRNRELAERLMEGEEEAMRLWPSVDDVARAQVEAMKEVVEGL